MRLLIVSNRLPFTVVKKEGKFEFSESAGGLVSGISAYLDYLKETAHQSSFPRLETEYIWIGWPGITVDDKNKEELKTLALKQFSAYPVFLTEDEMDKFYQGFCNKTIWPLFHYFPTYAVYEENYWSSYQRVNEIFGKAILEIIKPDDTVWIHDYHLMLLPKLLREQFPIVPIGFFLHIPFPSFEIFRLLPKTWRQEILNGLLGADLIGFHTYDYTQYFLRCVRRILGFEHNLGKIIIGERMVKADTFPMGIDYKRFYNAVSTPEVKKEREKLKKTLTNYKIILSVDRLDYTKGIINRLQGFEIFLERNPQWHKKVVLLLILVPSRIGVEMYQQMKNQIDELIGKINGRFGKIDWTPILYQYKFLSFIPLVALYSVSDVALITPLRDGMNLIAKEYLASRTDKTGVLILSEMAGAAQELGEAIIINPNNREEIAEALRLALATPEEEIIRRNQIMHNRLANYDVIRWAEDFLQALLAVEEEQKILNAKLFEESIQKQLIKDWKKANQRLILLDYDGTLVPFAVKPEKAVPSAELVNLLQKLTADSKNDVVLLSGRNRNNLQEWFGKLALGLVAEHGAWIKEKNREWQLLKPLRNDWKSKLLPILKIYTDRLPNSFIEEKEYSIVWHYRTTDPVLGELRVRELIDELIHLTANIDIQVLTGSKVVEIRNSGVNKGVASMNFLKAKDYDFILAIGDDWTDEDLFKILPATAYSIRVGMTLSYAKYNLRNHNEVLKLLTELIK
ncbi:MAG: bifunctional alpha,alpha-trehalose-phosphate synthase (UDP-forming)/trehalose-phosphatase [candidate division WOR-3 bacterium]